MRSLSMLFAIVIVPLLIALLLSAEAKSAELDGLIEPYMVANVGSGVRGIIETVDVDRGDFVKEGQVVATLQSGVEKATMELAQARAEIYTAIRSKEAQLAFTDRIKGVVVERFLAPGEFVEEQPILKIAQIDPLNVEAIVPVEFFGSIKVGMQAEVQPEEPVGGIYTAKVKIVDQVIDAASGTFGVRLELPNPGYKLPAGLKCKVIFPD